MHSGEFIHIGTIVSESGVRVTWIIKIVLGYSYYFSCEYISEYKCESLPIFFFAHLKPSHHQLSFVFSLILNYSINLFIHSTRLKPILWKKYFILISSTGAFLLKGNSFHTVSKRMFLGHYPFDKWTHCWAGVSLKGLCDAQKCCVITFDPLLPQFSRFIQYYIQICSPRSPMNHTDASLLILCTYFSSGCY